MCGPGDASCNKACRRGPCRRRSPRSFSVMDHGAHEFSCVLQIIIYVLLWCNKFLIVASRCRGGPNKCPMAISDFVLLHNKAAEGLAKHDRVGYDIYSGIADTKALFVKYCKQFEKRIRSMVPTHRVVPAGDGEDPKSVSIPGLGGCKSSQFCHSCECRCCHSPTSSRQR